MFVQLSPRAVARNLPKEAESLHVCSYSLPFFADEFVLRRSIVLLAPADGQASRPSQDNADHDGKTR